jgi:signal transduction histidine kinase
VSGEGRVSGHADRFAALVVLACHDLRTPLATVAGLSKTLVRTGELNQRDARFVEMIDEASAQMALLIDQLGLAARIESGRYDPLPLDANTLELAAASGDDRVAVEGTGAIVETDSVTVARALGALALAALRFGELSLVTWTVNGRELTLTPVTAAAAPVVGGTDPRDLGAIVARTAIERLGGSVTIERESLRVRI